MDPRVLGAIGGIAIGLIAGVVGSYLSIRQAQSNAERRHVLWWSVPFTLGIATYLAGVFLVSGPYTWLLGIPVLTIVLSCIAVNRSRLRFRNGQH